MKLVLIYLVLINLTGFAAFGLDKYKAKHHMWRIREATLFLFAILGGSLGCLAGMYLFRHKTRHLSFVIGIPVILVLELLIGFGLFIHFRNRTPYNQDPRALVDHELARFTDLDDRDLKQLTYRDLFPTESSGKPIPDDVREIFPLFFQSFSYKITNTEKKDDHAIVQVSLTTLDGAQLARDYSRQVLVKQIQNSANPSSVDFSLEDCYLLLGHLLKTNHYEPVTRDYRIALTRHHASWSFDDPEMLDTALTDSFASYVSDVHLFSPSEIVLIHLDTMKSFDTEQLVRYLNLDRLFVGDEPYRKSVAKALASQLLSCLNYSIASETISDDQTHATVVLDLTSCDGDAMMQTYQEQVHTYTQSAQALQDGSDGRLEKSHQLLIETITQNTATLSTPVSLQMTNDGSNWKLEINEDISRAILGNFTEAVQNISADLT